jgi:hypothetical protein
MPYRFDELFIGSLLEHIPQRAQSKCLSSKCRLLLHGQDDDLRVRRLLTDGRNRLQARAARHVQVQHKHFGMVPADKALCVFDVACLSDYLEAQYERQAPTWLRGTRNHTDGYLLLDGDVAALPVRRGRAIACLVNPMHAAAR